MFLLVKHILSCITWFEAICDGKEEVAHFIFGVHMRVHVYVGYVPTYTCSTCIHCTWDLLILGFSRKLNRVVVVPGPSSNGMLSIVYVECCP